MSITLHVEKIFYNPLKFCLLVYEKQAALYPEKLRSEYAKASGRLNIFSSIERHLKGADAAGSGPREGDAAGHDRYQKIEEQQRIMQEAFQKMAGAMTDMFRIMAAGKEGNLDAVPDDVVRRLMGLDDGEGE